MGRPPSKCNCRCRSECEFDEYVTLKSFNGNDGQFNYEITNYENVTLGYDDFFYGTTFEDITENYLEVLGFEIKYPPVDMKHYDFSFSADQTLLQLGGYRYTDDFGNNLFSTEYLQPRCVTIRRISKFSAVDGSFIEHLCDYEVIVVSRFRRVTHNADGTDTKSVIIEGEVPETTADYSAVSTTIGRFNFRVSLMSIDKSFILDRAFGSAGAFNRRYGVYNDISMIPGLDPGNNFNIVGRLYPTGYNYSAPDKEKVYMWPLVSKNTDDRDIFGRLPSNINKVGFKLTVPERGDDPAIDLDFFYDDSNSEIRSKMTSVPQIEEVTIEGADAHQDRFITITWRDEYTNFIFAKNREFENSDFFPYRSFESANLYDIKRKGIIKGYEVPKFSDGTDFAGGFDPPPRTFAYFSYFDSSIFLLDLIYVTVGEKILCFDYDFNFIWGRHFADPDLDDDDSDRFIRLYPPYRGDNSFGLSLDFRGGIVSICFPSTRSRNGFADSGNDNVNMISRYNGSPIFTQNMIESSIIPYIYPNGSLIVRNWLSACERERNILGGTEFTWTREIDRLNRRQNEFTFFSSNGEYLEDKMLLNTPQNTILCGDHFIASENLNLDDDHDNSTALYSRPFRFSNEPFITGTYNSFSNSFTDAPHRLQRIEIFMSFGVRTYSGSRWRIRGTGVDNTSVVTAWMDKETDISTLRQNLNDAFGMHQYLFFPPRPNVVFNILGDDTESYYGPQPREELFNDGATGIIFGSDTNPFYFHHGFSLYLFQFRNNGDIQDGGLTQPLLPINTSYEDFSIEYENKLFSKRSLYGTNAFNREITWSRNIALRSDRSSDTTGTSVRAAFDRDNYDNCICYITLFDQAEPGTLNEVEDVEYENVL